MSDDEGLREELAAAIWDGVDGYISGVPWERARQNVFQEAKALRRADAVLPVVERHAARLRAENADLRRRWLMALPSDD